MEDFIYVVISTDFEGNSETELVTDSFQKATEKIKAAINPCTYYVEDKYFIEVWDLKKGFIKSIEQDEILEKEE